MKKDVWKDFSLFSLKLSRSSGIIYIYFFFFYIFLQKGSATQLF